jgi:hypothetical protein
VCGSLPTTVGSPQAKRARETGDAPVAVLVQGVHDVQQCTLCRALMLTGSKSHDGTNVLDAQGCAAGRPTSRPLPIGKTPAMSAAPTLILIHRRSMSGRAKCVMLTAVQ